MSLSEGFTMRRGQMVKCAALRTRDESSRSMRADLRCVKATMAAILACHNRRMSFFWGSSHDRLPELAHQKAREISRNQGSELSTATIVPQSVSQSEDEYDFVTDTLRICECDVGRIIGTHWPIALPVSSLYVPPVHRAGTPSTACVVQYLHPQSSHS
jgi:hypothetical protein